MPAIFRDLLRLENPAVFERRFGFYCENERLLSRMHAGEGGLARKVDGGFFDFDLMSTDHFDGVEQAGIEVADFGRYQSERIGHLLYLLRGGCRGRMEVQVYAVDVHVVFDLYFQLA